MLEEMLIRLGQRWGKPPGWERVVRCLAPPERCTGLAARLIRTRDGLLFLADPATLLGWKLLFFGGYEGEVRELFRAILPPGGTAVDVGANVGWHTLLMAKLVGREGAVVAFEPHPGLQRQLAFSMAMNRLDNVRVQGCALSDRAGRGGFYCPDADGLGAGTGHLLGSAPGAEAIDVPVDLLDNVWPTLGLQRLDLIKIDIEGWELPALRGARATIARFRPHVCFEFDGDYIGRCGAAESDYQSFFAELGYRVFNVERTGMRELGRQWPAFGNLLAVPGEDQSRCRGTSG